MADAAAWKLARIDEIPSTNDAEWWQQWARDPDYGARWHSIRECLGITGFGVNQYEASAGHELVVPHNEMDFGRQEEIYVILRGRARFVCDGDEVDVGSGEVLYVPAEVEREARALETPTVVFMVGGIPGAYPQ